MQTSPSVQHTKPSYIREILRAATAENMISLAGGLPDESLFPMALLNACAEPVLKNPGSFQYGSTEGDMGLRQWLSQHLSCSIEELLITNGSQQALDLIARAYLSPGDLVVVESPCYLGALQIFKLAGVKIIAVPQQADGPDLQALEAAFAKRPSLFYSVPDFHNPSGVCWSLEKRRAVANLLKAYSVGLIEDAPYRDLYYDQLPLPRMTALYSDKSFLLGSFSKIAMPGMRIGYVQTPSALMPPLALIKQANDLHTSLPMQRILHAMLQTPDFDEHLSRLREAYRQKRDGMMHALHQQFGHLVHCFKPEGGMFLWVNMAAVDTRQLAEHALKQGVAIVPGSVFCPEDKQFNHHIRLNFSHASQQNINQGIERLSKAVNTLFDAIG